MAHNRQSVAALRAALEGAGINTLAMRERVELEAAYEALHRTSTHAATASREDTAENEQHRECRVCQDVGNADDLIAPCLCRGSLMFVHRACLTEWRARTANSTSFSSCEVCGFRYRTKVHANEEQKVRFYAFVARDALLAMATVLATVLLLGWLAVYTSFDQGILMQCGFGRLEPHVVSSWRQMRATSNVYMVLVGVVAFLLLLGLCGIVLTLTGHIRIERPGGMGRCNCFVGGGGFGVFLLGLLLFYGVFVAFVGVFQLGRQVVARHLDKLHRLREAERIEVLPRL